MTTHSFPLELGYRLEIVSFPYIFRIFNGGFAASCTEITSSGKLVQKWLSDDDQPESDRDRIPKYECFQPQTFLSPFFYYAASEDNHSIVVWNIQTGSVEQFEVPGPVTQIISDTWCTLRSAAFLFDFRLQKFLGVEVHYFARLRPPFDRTLWRWIRVAQTVCGVTSQGRTFWCKATLALTCSFYRIRAIALSQAFDLLMQLMKNLQFIFFLGHSSPKQISLQQSFLCNCFTFQQPPCTLCTLKQQSQRLTWLGSPFKCWRILTQSSFTNSLSFCF